MDVKQGAIIQLERKGFYIVDKAYDANHPESPLHLIYIPDGHVSSIASKNLSNGKSESPIPRTTTTGSGKLGGKSTPKVNNTNSSINSNYNNTKTDVLPMYKVEPFYTDIEMKPTCGSMYEVKSIYN